MGVQAPAGRANSPSEPGWGPLRVDGAAVPVPVFTPSVHTQAPTPAGGRLQGSGVTPFFRMMFPYLANSPVITQANASFARS